MALTPLAREPVAWARDLNGRWIVHHGLDERAAAYMAHLEATDPTRLVSACERAAQMVDGCDRLGDPKPRFYAGLFSVATVDEAKQYIAEHWFTAQCVPSLAGQPWLRSPPQGVGAETEAEIARIRQALSQLD